MPSSTDVLSRRPPPADHRLRYGTHAEQFGDLRLPGGLGAGRCPVVVVLHGGFWRAAYDLLHLGHLCAALTEGGVATWNLEYRRVGHEGGGWPGTFDDVRDGIDHVRELARDFPVDPEQIALVGFSAGAHLALWAAADMRRANPRAARSDRPGKLAGVVSLAGIPDLLRAWELGLGAGAVELLLGGNPDQVSERFRQGSPLHHLPLRVRQVIVHGSQDTEVPYALSEDYARAATAAGDEVQLLRIDGCGHLDLIDPHTEAGNMVVDSVRAVCSVKVRE